MDKKTLGITPSSDKTLQTLVHEGAFASELDAAKFAMSFAIRAGAPQGVTEGATTKWNVGTVDPDQSLRAIIEAIYPDENEPYRLVEYLMNEGLRLIGEEETLDVLTLLEAQAADAA